MRAYYKKKYLIVAFCIILCLILSMFLLRADDAKAQQSSGPSISVAPHTFDLSAQEGEEINQKIKIYNRCEIAIPLRVKINGFGAEEETGDMIEDNSQGSIIGWLEFEKENVMIDPGRTEEINFTVKIPEDAERRGYYAVIFLEADISTYLYNESKLQVIPGLGIPFMLKVGDEQTAEPLAILEYSISGENRLEKAEKALNFLTRPFTGRQNEIAVVKPGKPSFTVRLKNNSLYHAKLSGKIKLSGLGWKLKNELEFPPVTILPGRTRRVLVENQSGEGERALGILTALAAAEDKESSAKTGFGLMKATLDLESEGGVKKEESRWIIVFSWGAVILLLLAVSVTALAVLLLIKRKKSDGKPGTSKNELSTRGY